MSWAANNSSENPFEDNSEKEKLADPAFSNTKKGKQQDPDWLKKKEEELERKEKELSKKEKITEAAATGSYNTEPNFPPCRFLCFRPIFRQDINTDFAKDNVKRFIRLGWIAWWYTMACFVFNIASTLCALIIQATANSTLMGFFLSLGDFLLLGPFSCIVYRTLYGAAKKEGSALYFIWFILQWFMTGVYIFLAVGINGWGGGGLFVAIANFNSQNVIGGCIGIACTALWAINALLHFWIFVLARIEYGRIGGNAAAKSQGLAMAGSELAKRPDLIKAGLKAAV